MRHRVTVGTWQLSTPRPLTDAEIAELQQIVLQQGYQAMQDRLRAMTQAHWDWRPRFAQREASDETQ
jgi:ribulose bisphosphate carboxylase small subunit